MENETMADRQFLEQLSKKMADEGKLIEAGWIGLRLAWIPLNAPKDQIQQLRDAFMAGAQHLFSSIMEILDPGDDPTTADLTRMDLINKELLTFYNEMQARIKTDGRA